MIRVVLHAIEQKRSFLKRHKEQLRQLYFELAECVSFKMNIECDKKQIVFDLVEYKNTATPRKMIQMLGKYISHRYPLVLFDLYETEE